MIGVVVVSHSRDLAEAATALARQMVPADSPLRVAVAAGVAEGGLGTDATAVAAAIEAVGRSGRRPGAARPGQCGAQCRARGRAAAARTAGRRVRLSAAPLVEGLVAALVLAATGADLDRVAAEAEQGLAAKQAHLGDAGPAGSRAGRGAVRACRSRSTVTDPHGLHARPAAALVALAHRFDAAVRIENLDAGTGPADARSSERGGHAGRPAPATGCAVSATGPEAAQVLRAVERLPVQRVHRRGPTRVATRLA